MPDPGRPFILVTDASEDGGGGVLLQEGEGDGGEKRCRFLGHWGWKWSGARRRYAAFERELLAGILLLASQAELLKAAPAVVWMTDAAAIPAFLKAEPPTTNARRTRWWFFTRQFPLACHHVAGDKNELADQLSRGVATFEQVGLDLDAKAREAFQRMDAALDLSLVPVLPSSLTGTFAEAVAACEEGRGLEDGGWRHVGGAQWSREGDRLYKEVCLVVPPQRRHDLLSYLHAKLGHPGPLRVMAYVKLRYFFAGGVATVTEDLKAIGDSCEVCCRTKANRPRDRGRAGVLPLPEVCGSEVAFDLVGLGDGMKALFMMETLTAYTQAVVLPDGTTEAQVCRALWGHWLVPYGAPARFTADNDPRWTGREGPFRDLLELFGVEMHYTTPYASQTNGRCERGVAELRKALRKTEDRLPGMSWGDRLVVAVALLNATPREPSGWTPSELFHHGRPQWPENLSPLASLRSSLGVEVEAATGEVRAHMAEHRERRRLQGERRHPPTQVRVGCWVYVHRDRFPSKMHEPRLWHGPFLVDALHRREAQIVIGAHRLRVHLSQVKIAPAREEGAMEVAGGDGAEMTTEEMAAEGYYRTEQVLAHRRWGPRGFQVKVLWEDGTSTWTSLTNLLLPQAGGGLRASDDLAAYLREAGDGALTAAVEAKTGVPFSAMYPALPGNPPPSALVSHRPLQRS